MSKQTLSRLCLFLIATLLIFWRINDRYVAFTDELLFEEASYRFALADRKPISHQLTPSLGGEAWLEKPPMYFWMTSMVFKVVNWFTPVLSLGEVIMEKGEFVYPWVRRFWTAMAGIITVMLTYFIGRKWLSHKHGLMAGILLLGMPLFLSTTKAASLDMLGTMWMVGTLYFYLIAKERPHPNPFGSESQGRRPLLKGEGSPSSYSKRGLGGVNRYTILAGLCLGLGIMSRSWLGLTPVVVMVGDLTISSALKAREKSQPERLNPRGISRGFPSADGSPARNGSFMSLLIITITAILIAAPWHIWMWITYGKAFVNTYFGFNVIGHVVNLTPGYEETGWWFYVVTLVKTVPWLVPVLVAAALYIAYEKKVQSKKEVVIPANAGTHGRDKERPVSSHTAWSLIRSMDSRLRGNDITRILVLWFLIPFVSLSLAKTRHEWYLVQALPPLALLMSIVVLRTYQALQVCKECRMVKYMAEMTFFTFLLAGVFAVLTAVDPSAPTVKAVRWARDNMPAEEPIYVYGQDYFPETLLFHPKKTEVVDEEGLARVLENGKEIYVFIADSDIEVLRKRFPGLKLVKEFKLGKIYH